MESGIPGLAAAAPVQKVLSLSLTLSDKTWFGYQSANIRTWNRTMEHNYRRWTRVIEALKPNYFIQASEHL